MFLMIKNKFAYLLLVISTLLLLQGCANREQSTAAMQRALDNELLQNQEKFLNKPISDVLAAFQRQPTSISIVDKTNDAVWLYDIYDSLIDPQTGQAVIRPDQLAVFQSKIHWQEYYYANADGIVYDIKVESEKF